MISTGTGVAPFLSLLKEKNAFNQLDGDRFVLIHGARNKEQDEIEKDFLETLVSDKKLTLFKAFS